MIHGHEGIGIGTVVGIEQRVGGVGPGHIQPLLTAVFDGSTDDRIILMAQVAIFACMGIESGDADARRADAESRPQVLCGDPNHGLHRCRCDRVRHLTQGQMGGGQRHTQCGARQHHHRPHAAQLARHRFGVPRKGNARLVDDAFLNGARDHAAATLLSRPGHRLLQRA